jgi:hypothetical protein
LSLLSAGGGSRHAAVAFPPPPRCDPAGCSCLVGLPPALLGATSAGLAVGLGVLLDAGWGFFAADLPTHRPTMHRALQTLPSVHDPATPQSGFGGLPRTRAKAAATLNLDVYAGWAAYRGQSQEAEVCPPAPAQRSKGVASVALWKLDVWTTQAFRIPPALLTGGGWI